MGLHLFISICLAVAGTLVSAAFGIETWMCALIGLIIFGLYWGVCVIWVSLEDIL
jgi:hypothetical protein